MYYILRISFFVFLFIYGFGKSPLYKFLVFLQFVSFVIEYMIDAYKVRTDDVTTYFCILYSELILLLIILPWSKVRIKSIQVKSKVFQNFFERSLIPVLVFVFIVNFVIAIIIIYMFPDVSEYKLKNGWQDLYETIPLFAFFNRFSYITQFLGYFAVPISFYYFSRNNNKRGLLFVILSGSSLMAGIAQYSRAQMLVYALCLMTSFFLFQNIFSERKKMEIKRYSKKIIILILIIFLYTTVNRFSSDNMAYYGERIPPSSMIQDPILYSFADYSSQGFTNGINHLVRYKPSYNFMGQDIFYYPLLFLDYFGVIEWDSAEASENRDSIFDDGGGFHGYACTLVYNFGFLLTFLLGLIYFSYIKRKVGQLSRVSMNKAYILTYLVIEPACAIFYSSIGVVVFPLCYYFAVKFVFIMKYRIKM